MYERMDAKHSWNGNNRLKSEYPDRNLSHRHFVHDRSYMDLSGNGHAPPQWVACEKPCDLYVDHG